MTTRNNTRARWANAALQEFRLECESLGDELDEVMFQDLLVDFMHLATAQGWDMEDALAKAKAIYREEVEEEGGPATADFAEDE